MNIIRVFLLSVLGVLTFWNSTLSQCPANGLKIYSDGCESPKSLTVAVPSCLALNVEWKGKPNQIYTINVISNDPVTGKIFEVELSKYSCDLLYNCNATVPVKEGMEINWSVQGVCKEDSTILYSYKSEGEKVSIPFCNEVPNIASLTLRVYPNPTNGNLTIDYSGQVTRNTKFTVLDVAGKEAFSKAGDGIQRTNAGYKLDLHNLIGGTYFLKISNGKDVRQAKFILLKN